MHNNSETHISGLHTAARSSRPSFGCA